MQARLVNRLDGRWHFELWAEESEQEIGSLIVCLNDRKLEARRIGGLIIVEVEECKKDAI